MSPPSLWWLLGSGSPADALEVWGLVVDWPASLAEIPLVFLPVFRWVSLVFSVLLARLVMSVWMVVVSAHPVRPPGCRDGEARRVKPAGCHCPPHRDGKRNTPGRPGTAAAGSGTARGRPGQHTRPFYKTPKNKTNPNPILQTKRDFVYQKSHIPGWCVSCFVAQAGLGSVALSISLGAAGNRVSTHVGCGDLCVPVTPAPK